MYAPTAGHGAALPLPWGPARWATLVALAVAPAGASVDLRVAKGMYTRGYDALRVSVVTERPGQVSAPWNWSWQAPFRHRWRSMTLHSHVVHPAPQGQALSIGGERVRLKLPAPGSGVSGVLVSDPCFTSRGGFRCPNGARMKVLERLPKILNALLQSEDFHFWGILGDNFYDMHGGVTREFFEVLSMEVKSKPFFTVVGNHDLWMGGAPPGIPADQLGYAFMQFYGQDTAAATEREPYNFTGNLRELELPAAENFIFGAQIGDLAFFGYSGAHGWPATRRHAADFCAFVGATPSVNAVVILGHWNVANLGCAPDMDVPSIYKRMKKLAGCEGKPMVYFMGHDHCNKVAEQESGPLDAFGFMIGGVGMWGTDCSQFGVTVLRSVPRAPGGPNVAVEHIPLAEDSSFGKDPLALTEGFDDLLACLNTAGYAGCRDRYSQSFRAVSEEATFTPRPPTRPARSSSSSSTVAAGARSMPAPSHGAAARGTRPRSSSAGPVARPSAGGFLDLVDSRVLLAGLGGALAGGGAVALMALLLLLFLHHGQSPSRSLQAATAEPLRPPWSRSSSPTHEPGYVPAPHRANHSLADDAPAAGNRVPPAPTTASSCRG